MHSPVLATKKCFIQVKEALVNSHDCYHATTFPLQIKITMLAIRTFLCNMSKRFSPTLLLNRTDVLFVIYLKFSTFIPYQLDIFHQSVPQCLSFLITLLAFIILTHWFQFLMTSTDVISFPVFYPYVSGCPKFIRFLISSGMQNKKGLQCCTAQWVKLNNSQTAHLRPALNRCVLI